LATGFAQTGTFKCYNCTSDEKDSDCWKGLDTLPFDETCELGCAQFNVKTKLQTKSSTTTYNIVRGCIAKDDRPLSDKPNVGCTDIKVDVSLFKGDGFHPNMTKI
jgi:hypothetical protein